MSATPTTFQNAVIVIKGAGEMASAVAHRLRGANFHRIVMMEVEHPLAVRRQVSFCEAVHNGTQTVEGITAAAACGLEGIHEAWDRGHIAVVVDPDWQTLKDLAPDVCVDAILAKMNLGTTLADAPTVIGLGPGFVAGKDVHMVIETQRGHHLGRILTSGGAAPNTGIPGNIGGHTEKRVLRAPADGCFKAETAIGTRVIAGDRIGSVGGAAILAGIDGVVRGLIHPGAMVTKGLKLGDIDPRGDPDYCTTISDKARAIAGAVLEAVLRNHLPPSRTTSRPAQNTPAPADLDVTGLMRGVRDGDIRAISSAITIIETAAPESGPLTEAVFSHAGNAHRIGITGPPGAGKSTFAAQLVKRLRDGGRTVGVIAVDPSSPFTGGAFFGDRLRMRHVSADAGVFIRSMATRGNPGGLSRQAVQAADVLDAAGKDVIIFETAGVGQVEIDIMSAADTVIVTTIPDAGDMIQGMKCGVMEIGDIYLVNKADLPGADAMKADIEAVLHMKDNRDRWPPVVRTTDAINGIGFSRIIEDIDAHFAYLREKGILAEKRMARTAMQVRAMVNDRMVRGFWTEDRTQALNRMIHDGGGRYSAAHMVARILDSG